MLVMTVKAELRVHKKLDATKHSKTLNRSRLLHRSLVVAMSLLLVSVSSILYVNFDDELYKYAFSASSGVLGFVVFLCYTVCSENAQSMCSSSHPIEEDSEKQEPRLKSRSNSFQSFLKPEIVSESYCGTKMPQTVEVDLRMDKIRKLRFQMEHVSQEEKDWKEVDHLLVEKGKMSSMVREVTVHHVSLNPSKDMGLTHSDSEDGFRDLDTSDPSSQRSFRKQWRKRIEDPLSPPFELQQLEGSPRSSHLHISDLDVIGPDGEESTTPFFEYTAGPDILEPATSHHPHLTHSCQQVLIAPSQQCPPYTEAMETQELVELPRVVCEDQCALVNEGLRTSQYTTFRPVTIISKSNPMSSFLGNSTIVEEDETQANVGTTEEATDTNKGASEEQERPPCPPFPTLEKEKVVESSMVDSTANPSIQVAAAVVEAALKRDGMRKDIQVPAQMVTVTEKEQTVPSQEQQNVQSKKGWSITTV